MKSPCVHALSSGLKLKSLLAYLNKVNQMIQLASCSLSASTANLIAIVIQASYTRAREASDVTGRATNTTANVQSSHAFTKTQARGEPILMFAQGLLKSFLSAERCEVEALSPANSSK